MSFKVGSIHRTMHEREQNISKNRWFCTSDYRALSGLSMTYICDCWRLINVYFGCHSRDRDRMSHRVFCVYNSGSRFNNSYRIARIFNNSILVKANKYWTLYGKCIHSAPSSIFAAHNHKISTGTKSGRFFVGIVFCKNGFSWNYRLLLSFFLSTFPLYQWSVCYFA